jgi:hypothetical protein
VFPSDRIWIPAIRQEQTAADLQKETPQVPLRALPRESVIAVEVVVDGVETKGTTLADALMKDLFAAALPNCNSYILKGPDEAEIAEGEADWESSLSEYVQFLIDTNTRGEGDPVFTATSREPTRQVQVQPQEDLVTVHMRIGEEEKEAKMAENDITLESVVNLLATYKPNITLETHSVATDGLILSANNLTLFIKRGFVVNAVLQDEVMNISLDAAEYSREFSFVSTVASATFAQTIEQTQLFPAGKSVMTKYGVWFSDVVLKEQPCRQDGKLELIAADKANTIQKQLCYSDMTIQMVVISDIKVHPFVTATKTCLGIDPMVEIELYDGASDMPEGVTFVDFESDQIVLKVKELPSTELSD